MAALGNSFNQSTNTLRDIVQVEPGTPQEQKRIQVAGGQQLADEIFADQENVYDGGAFKVAQSAFVSTRPLSTSISTVSSSRVTISTV